MAGDYVEKLEKRLGEPGVKEAVAEGLRTMAEGLMAYNWDEYYKGYIGYTAAATYGKLGLGIDWSKPPVLGEREEKCLRAMEQLARDLKQGNSILAQHWMSTSDLLIAPELAVIVGIAKVSVEELLGRSGVRYFWLTNGQRAGGSLEAVIYNYRTGGTNRAELAEALMNLALTTTAHLDKGNLLTWLVAARKNLLRRES